MSAPKWLRPLPGSNGFVGPRTGGVVAALLNPRLMAATPPELKRIEAEASERLEAGGFAAISRWLSAATPPVRRHHSFHCIPAGMPALCAAIHQLANRGFIPYLERLCFRHTTLVSIVSPNHMPADQNLMA